MSDARQQLQARLARSRARSRQVLWLERVWPSLWPAIAVVGAWLVAALFDLPSSLPPAWHLGLEALVLAGVGVLLWRGLRPLTRPTDAEVDRRLESATGLRHRPLVTIGDKPAATDAASASLWQAHVERARADLSRLRVGWPHPGIPQRDVRATRAALALLLVAGAVVAGPEALPRSRRSLGPARPQGPSAPAPELQAWLTPPSYTGQPPLFLRGDTPAVAVPAGSHLTVSLTGGTGAPSLSFAGQTIPFAALDAQSWQAERDVAQSGTLSVFRHGRAQGTWDLTAIPDAPPTVAWADPPGPGRDGRRLQIRLPWTATDDYGVVSLQAELRLRDRPAAEPIVINIPVPGSAAKSAHGVASQELIAHPWAGLPVVATLVAKDAPGQRATGASAAFTLPERTFKNALARALIDIRKRLSLQPDQHAQAASDLAALADEPDAFDNNAGIFLTLSTTAKLLDRSGEPVDVAEAQGRLWSLALQLEDDAVARTAQAVQAARQALQQSVQKGDKSDIEKKAEALRREIQRHLQALAEQAKRDGTLMPFDPSTRTLGQQDFDKLTKQMQEAARAGRMDEAQDKLQELQRMLDQLKQAEANPSGDRKQARQQRQRGQQQMGAAEDMIAREGAMKEHAGQRAQPPAGQPQAGPPAAPAAPGDNPPQATASREQDSRQQRALRRALGQMMQNFGDLTGKVPDQLSQADIAMDQANQALAAGKDGEAGAADQRAIDALKQGEQQMSQQMASSLGISVQPGEGEGQGGGPGDQMTEDDGQGDENGQSHGPRDADNGPDGQSGTEDAQRDPLGRPTQDGSSGRADGGDVHVPDQMEAARTRDLQAELRRREGQRTRPEGELEYINRLLKPY